jgi:hypothetical protein
MSTEKKWDTQIIAILLGAIVISIVLSWLMKVEGRRFDFVMLITACALVYYAIDQARKGDVPEVRPLAAMEALDEVVGRAAEMGSSVHYSTGVGGLHDQYAPMTIAGLSILGEVASLCGKYAVPLRYTCVRSYIIPIAEDLVKAGYVTGGNPEMYTPDMVLYVGEEQRAFMSSVMGHLMRDRPATNLIFGATFWETIIQLGTGAVAGCVNVGGTPRLYYLPIVICCCDYFLIGEELYTAAAVVDKSPPQLGSVFGQDLVKMLSMVLIVLSIILLAAGTTWFGDLVDW